MRILLLLAASFPLVSLAVADSASAQPRPSEGASAPAAPQGGLVAFRSDAELRAYLRRLKRREEAIPVFSPPSPPPAPEPAASAAGAPAAQSNVGETLNDLPALKSTFAQGITNNQEASVDEGGIVKVRGDTLVILRRGRLFTVSLAGGRMRPVDSIDAFPPRVSGRGAWYDEMLLAGDRVIVVGYSYDRGGTEINRFRLDAAGRLRFEDAWHLRSNDYYSSRNYASRLIGNRLIFYTPLDLDWEDDPFDVLPGVRRWHGRGSEDDKFQRIARARQIFIAPAMRKSADAVVDTLHSIVNCDLTAADLGCSATAVLGPGSRTFYVSPQAVYLWISDAWQSNRPESYLYRLPLGRERPSATAARGVPIDQFSFREDGAEGILNVLVRSDGGGDAMFAPEWGGSGGGVALLRVPFSDFGDASRQVPRSRYLFLPSVPGWQFHNRFAGDYVLYGAGVYGDGAASAPLVAARIRDGRATRLTLPHSVDRIELLGRDAMVIGATPRGLGFSTVQLDGAAPALGDRYVHPDSEEGESRSHAFFFSPDPGSPDGASGTVGLPVAKRADPALARFFGSSAAMVFLRRERRRLAPAGELEAQTRGVTDDDCQASCVDWYGNARPIFWGGRTFALLGYELVEGELARGRIREVGRISFAPAARPRQ